MPKITTLTNPDLLWLAKLVEIAEYIHSEYPELFNDEDEETLLIARQLVKEKMNEGK